MMDDQFPFDGSAVAANVETIPVSLPRPDMSILGASDSSPPEMPLGFVGEFWSDWIYQEAKAIAVPRDYIALPLMSVAAGLIGNARQVSPWEGWTQPSVLWTAIIGEPSSRKTPAMKVPLGMVRELEAESFPAYKEDRKAYEAAEEGAKIAAEVWRQEAKKAEAKGDPRPPRPEAATAPEPPTMSRYTVEDATIEKAAVLLQENPKGLIASHDELCGLLENFGRFNSGADRPFYLKAYDAQHHIVDRQKNPEPIVIPRMALSLTGGIQPDKLRSVLMSGDDDGLSSRFIMCWPERLPPTRPSGYEANPFALKSLRRLSELRPRVGEDGREYPLTMRLSAPAADLFQEWREACDKRDRSTTGLYRSFCGKLDGNALRFSLVATLLQWAATSEEEPPDEVTEETLGQVLEFLDDYAIPMQLRIYGAAAFSEAEFRAAKIAERIAQDRPALVNRSDVLRSWGVFPHHAKAAEAEAAFKVLVDARWLFPAPSREGDTQGRQKGNYTVNSHILKGERP